MTTDISEVAPLSVSTVAELAAVTKSPVQAIFDSLATDGSLEDALIAANPVFKAGSVKTALKLLVQNGFVAKRNAKSGKRGRPAILFFRASEAPALPEPKPAKVATAEPVAVTEAAPIALTEITG